MTPAQFVSQIRALRFENAFNPYSDRCSVHDVPDAPKRRADALQRMLEAAIATEVDALWIGRDLGYRGGRRTGLALTDDVHLACHAMRWKIRVERPTAGAMISERTAAIVWNMLARVTAPVFLWNVFPFHPHEPGDPFTNRSHNSRERAAGEAVLAELILILKPRRIVGIGNDAAKAAARLGGADAVAQVRHPSYGGQREFEQQVRDLYQLRVDEAQRALL